MRISVILILLFSCNVQKVKIKPNAQSRGSIMCHVNFFELKKVFNLPIEKELDSVWRILEKDFNYISIEDDSSTYFADVLWKTWLLKTDSSKLTLERKSYLRSFESFGDEELHEVEEHIISKKIDVSSTEGKLLYDDWFIKIFPREKIVNKNFNCLYQDSLNRYCSVGIILSNESIRLDYSIWQIKDSI